MIGNFELEPLIAIPVFIHDFLCIHPFNDGNGRMSRLLTTLLLYRSGFYVGKYISLEAKIAKDKDLYYDALSRSQDGWHEGTKPSAMPTSYSCRTAAGGLYASESVRKTANTSISDAKHSSPPSHGAQTAGPR